jgi:hypothetical protein
MFCTGQASALDGADHCGSLGMHLVSIDSQSLDVWLWERMTALGVDRYWTGGNDIQMEESWVWADGTVFYDEDNASPVGGRYTNWMQDEPSGNTDEDCLYVSDAEWRDRACVDEFAYVCEESP